MFPPFLLLPVFKAIPSSSICLLCYSCSVYAVQNFGIAAAAWRRFIPSWVSRAQRQVRRLAIAIAHVTHVSAALLWNQCLIDCVGGPAKELHFLSTFAHPLETNFCKVVHVVSESFFWITPLLFFSVMPK